MIEVLDERQSGGGQSAHGVEVGVEGVAVVARQGEREGSDGRDQQPGEGDDHHPVAPVEAMVVDLDEARGRSEHGEDPDHDQETRGRRPLPGNERPHQGNGAGKGGHQGDPAQLNPDDAEVVRFRAKEHQPTRTTAHHGEQCRDEPEDGDEHRLDGEAHEPADDVGLAILSHCRSVKPPHGTLHSTSRTPDSFSTLVTASTRSPASMTV